MGSRTRRESKYSEIFSVGQLKAETMGLPGVWILGRRQKVDCLAFDLTCLAVGGRSSFLMKFSMD